MAIDNFIKILLDKNLLLSDNVLQIIANQIGIIETWNYDAFIDACKKNHIEDKSFFMNVYANASEDVRYRLWQDGYVDSCPVPMLIEDIVCEDEDTRLLVKHKYGEELPFSEVHFYDIQNVVVDLILQARKSLKIAMCWFTNPVIFKSLMKACKKGVEVTLLINNDPVNNRVNGLQFDKLIENNANVYIAQYPSFIHHKFFVVDEQTVVEGTYNWTILAEENNEGNIVILRNEQVTKSFIDKFESLLVGSIHINFMPGVLPAAYEDDYWSYRYLNSEEYLLQLPQIKSKHLKYEIYKSLYEILPEELHAENIPSDILSKIKQEIDEDANLFKDSVDKLSGDLERNIENKEQKIASSLQKVDRLNDKKNKEILAYKSQLESIKSKQSQTLHAESQISELSRNHKSRLRKLNKSIKERSIEIDNHREEMRNMIEQREFVDSIQNTELQGGNGLFRANLKWNTEDDLDLHLVLPNGSLDSVDDIYYHNMRAEYNGGVCTLDHDAIPQKAGEHSQENIIWENKLPDGKYDIVVKLFSKKSNRKKIPFSVTAFAGNYVKTELFNFDNAKSNDTITIATITFKKGKLVKPIVFNNK